MASYVQILFPLLCIVLAEGHILDALKSHFGHSNLRLPHFSRNPGGNEHHNPLTPNSDDRPEDERPINGDIFSYNSQHAYNRFYHDGFNPAMGMDPYFGYPGPYNMHNFDNMPGVSPGFPNIYNGFHFPGQGYPDHFTNEMHGPEIPDEKPDISASEKNDKENEKPKEGENSGPEKEESDKPKLEDTPPKTNKVTHDKSTANQGDDKPDLHPNKDFLLVDNNGNNVYLLHQNEIPNPNTVIVPNANLPVGGNVVYVPYPQQPGNQVYQVVNGQPAIPSNIPLTPNRQDLNGYNTIMTSPPQGNLPSNPGDPSYVLIYANGQLIKLPGVVVNSQQNNMPVANGMGSNVMVANPIPNNNSPSPAVPNMYSNLPNQGNTPVVYPMPNTAFNSAPTGTPMNNIQPSNPAMIPNNNIGVYGNQPNPMQQPSGALPNNGYVQPSVGSQGSLPNTLNPNPAGPINNQPMNVQPAVSLPVNNNPNMYQPLPNQEKEVNGATGSTDAPEAVNQPQNSPPVTQPPAVPSNAYLPEGVHPAIMVSGFKETEGDKKDVKKDKDDKKDKKEKADKNNK